MWRAISVALVLVVAAACEGRQLAGDAPQDPVARNLVMPAPPPVEAASGVVVLVGRPAPAAGDVVEQERRVAVRLARQRGDQVVPIEITSDRRSRLEVLAVRDGIVTALRVSYLAESRDGKVAGVSTPWTALLRGKSYRVEWVDGRLSLRHEPDGAPVAGAEAARLADDVRAWVGRPAILADAVGGRVIESGDVIDLPRSEVAAALGERARVSVAEARLIDVADGTALFELHVASRVQVDGIEAEVESRELTSLSIATGRVLESSSRGTLSDPASLTSGTREESIRNRYQEVTTSWSRPPMRGCSADRPTRPATPTGATVSGAAPKPSSR